MHKNISKIISVVLSGVMALSSLMLPASSISVQAADIPVRETIETEPASGNIIIGVEGLDNTSNMTELINRINEVRYQACNSNRVPDPRNTNEFLKPSDYVPIKLGKYCMEQAAIRSAEASIYLGHVRTNGKDCTSILSAYSGNISAYYGGSLPNSPGSYVGENLAWNYISGSDIEGWIEEEEDWIKWKNNPPSGVQVGHYSSLIDPRFKFTGMSTFNPVNDSLQYNWSCTAGAYASNDVPVTVLSGAQNKTVIQKMEIPVSRVTNADIVGDSVLHAGDNVTFGMLVAVKFSGLVSNTVVDCPVYDGVTWSSSAPSVISINEDGTATVKGLGRAEIIGKIGSGSSEITVEKNIVVLGAGVSVTSVSDPAMVYAESFKTPVLSKYVSANLSDGTSVDVDVKWDSYDSENLKTHFRSNEFEVTGKALGYDVVQRVHINAATITATKCVYFDRTNNVVTRTFSESDPLVTDSGVLPVYPEGAISLSNGYTWRPYAITWDDESKNYYKSRKGGNFILNGTVVVYTDSGSTKVPVTLNMTVNPATITAVEFKGDGATIETVSGFEPAYPKATVTWSNGDVTEEMIAWSGAEPSDVYNDVNDPSRKYKMKDGGEYQLSGTYNGLTTTITVKVKPAVASKAEIETDKRYIEVNCGTDPSSLLAEQATVTWSNGDVTSENINWNSISSDAYNIIQGNNFDVSGECGGKAVTTNISVLPASVISIDTPALLKVPEKVDPTGSLPETVNVNWSNNTSSPVAVTWDEISASSYLAPGQFTVEGYITDMYGNQIKVTNKIEITERKLSSAALKGGKLSSDTSYYNYQKNDITGTLVVTYDNGDTREVVLTPAMITGFDADSTDSSQAITITYTEGQISRTVTATIYLIKRTGIKIHSNPAKLNYIEDECDKLDISGIEIIEELDNGEENIISADNYSVNNFSGFNPNPKIYGNQTITLSLFGFTDSFTVNVKKKTLDDVEIISMPSKIKYVQGQDFDISGLKISGKYDNGKSNDLSVSDAIIRMNPVNDPDHPENNTLGEVVNTSQVGTITVYVFYQYEAVEENGVTYTSYCAATFDITVVERCIETVAIKTNPSKLSFPQHDTSFGDYNFSDGELLVTYNDESEETIGFNEAALQGFNIDKLGDQTINVTYGGKTVSFNAVVRAPLLVRTYAVPPEATGYAEGEVLNLSGAAIKLEYDNGITETVDLNTAIISGDATVSFADGSELSGPLNGDKKLVITYKSQTLKDADGNDIQIGVSERTGINVVQLPDKTMYVEGQMLDISGIVINSVFENGKTSVVPADDYSVADVTGYNPEVIGKQTLTIKVYGKETTFDINVRKKRISSIQVTSRPVKTSYAVGQPLDITGLSVKCIYDNNTEGVLSCSNDGDTDITLEDIRLNVGTTGNGIPWNTNTSGNAIAYYVTYKEDYENAPYVKALFSLSIEPKTVQSVKIITYPKNTAFIQDSISYSDSESFSDGILEVTNNCDFVERLGFRDSGVQISGFNISEVSEQTVTVSCGGKADSFIANVIKPSIQSKTVTPPSKTNYTEGESVSLEGAAIVLSYNNGRSETIDLSDKPEELEKYGVKVMFVDSAGREYSVNDPAVTTTTGAKSLVVRYRTSAEGEPEVYEELKMSTGTQVSVNVTEKKNPSGGNGGNGSGGNGSGGNGSGGNGSGGNGSGGNGSGGNGNGGNGSGGNGSGGNGSGRNGSGGNGGSGNLVRTSSGTQYKKADGSYAKNEWVTINGVPYYFNADSFNASEEWRDGKWISADGSCTYKGILSWKCNSTGWWVEDSAGWYPTDSWQKIDGIWYYFNSSGYMASNEYYKGYWFNADGSWDSQYFLTWKSNSTGWWVEDKSGWWPASKWLKVDGYWYYFNASGYMVTNQYVDGYWIGSDGVCY